MAYKISLRHRMAARFSFTLSSALLAALALPLTGWSQTPSPVTVLGPVQDAGGNPATSGTVEFDVQPVSSGIHYYVPGVAAVAPQTVVCNIVTGGTLQSQTGGACNVWGNDVLSPSNSTYTVTFSPGGVQTNSVAQESITGAGPYNLNAPVFAPSAQIIPQYSSITAAPINANITPAANNVFTVGNAQAYFQTGYFNNLFMNHCYGSGCGSGGSYPGVTGDGRTPGGLNIAGGVTLGNQTLQAWAQPQSLGVVGASFDSCAGTIPSQCWPALVGAKTGSTITTNKSVAGAMGTDMVKQEFVNFFPASIAANNPIIGNGNTALNELQNCGNTTACQNNYIANLTTLAVLENIPRESQIWFGQASTTPAFTATTGTSSVDNTWFTGLGSTCTSACSFTFTPLNPSEPLYILWSVANGGTATGSLSCNSGAVTDTYSSAGYASLTTYLGATASVFGKRYYSAGGLTSCTVSGTTGFTFELAANPVGQTPEPWVNFSENQPKSGFFGAPYATHGYSGYDSELPAWDTLLYGVVSQMASDGGLTKYLALRSPNPAGETVLTNNTTDFNTSAWYTQSGVAVAGSLQSGHPNSQGELAMANEWLYYFAPQATGFTWPLSATSPATFASTNPANVGTTAGLCNSPGLDFYNNGNYTFGKSVCQDAAGLIWGTDFEPTNASGYRMDFYSASSQYTGPGSSNVTGGYLFPKISGYQTVGWPTSAAGISEFQRTSNAYSTPCNSFAPGLAYNQPASLGVPSYYTDAIAVGNDNAGPPCNTSLYFMMPYGGLAFDFATYAGGSDLTTTSGITHHQRLYQYSFANADLLLTDSVAPTSGDVMEVLNQNGNPYLHDISVPVLNIPQVCSDTSGSGTAQSCSTPAPFTTGPNSCVTYSTTTANSGDITINVNGSGGLHVHKWLGMTLAAGDLPAGQPQLICESSNGQYWNVYSIGNAPGGGSVTGSGTTNTIPLWTGSTALGNSPLSVVSGVVTSSDPVAITGNPGITMAAGAAVAGAAGKVVYSTDATNGYAEVNENNTGLSRVCTAANVSPVCVPRSLTVEGRNTADTADTAAVADYSNMARWCDTAENNFSTLQLKFRGVYQQPGSYESPIPNAVILRAALEYPVGSVSNQITVRGLSTWVVQPWGNLLSDPIGAFVPAGGKFCIRTYERVSAPVASPSATPTSATVTGLLSTSTTYHYMVTTVDNGIESGPTADFTCATSTSTACTLAWTIVANGTPSAYNIYRGTSATANQHYLVGSAVGTSTGWVDTGLTTASASTPPSALGIIYNSVIGTNDSATTTGGTANVADTTGSTGALANVGPGAKYGVRPFITLTNDSISHPVACAGDSICAGLGIISVFTLGSGDPVTQNFFGQGFPEGTWNSLNSSYSGAQACAYAHQNQLSPWVSSSFDVMSGGYVMLELGRNDLYTGAGWLATAACNLSNAQALQSKNVSVYGMTVGPNTTSTDDFLTIANQTAINSTYETARENYNNWIRNGMQVANQGSCIGTISATTLTCTSTVGTLAIGQVLNSPGITIGTTITGGSGPTWTISTSQSVSTPQTINALLPCNTAACGTASSYYSGWWDFASALGEVNSSGVATLNGGFWPAAATVLTPTTLSGAQTTSVLAFTGTPFALGCCTPYIVQDTTLGQLGQIASLVNTASTNMYANGASRPTNTGTFVGFTTSPSSGDAVSFFSPYTLDGVHPTFLGHTTAGTVLASWATANLKP